MKNKITLLLTLVLPALANAGTLLVPNGDEIKVLIPPGGTFFQFSSPIKAISGSKSFEFQNIGDASDVKLVSVTPSDGRSERVSFVLANGKTVNTKLVHAKEGDKHYDFLFGTEKKPKSVKFINAELALLKSMIKDDAVGVGRQVTDGKVDLKGLEDLSARQIRRFVSGQVSGIVMEIRNTSSTKLKLSADQFKQGNRLVLAHLESETLEACPIIGSRTHCKTKLFLVSRGDPGNSESGTSPFIKLEERE